MTRGNQREVNRKRAEARLKENNPVVKPTTKMDDAERMRQKQMAANARKEQEVATKGVTIGGGVRK